LYTDCSKPLRAGRACSGVRAQPQGARRRARRPALGEPRRRRAYGFSPGRHPGVATSERTASVRRSRCCWGGQAPETCARGLRLHISLPFSSRLHRSLMRSSAQQTSLKFEVKIDRGVARRSIAAADLAVPLIKRWTSVQVSAMALLFLSIGFVACGGSSYSTTATPFTAGAATTKPSSSATAGATAKPSSSPSTAATAAASLAAGNTVATAANAKLGKTILVDAAGNTLYTYAKDTSGSSACTGTCAAIWPPLTIASGSTPKDGSGVLGMLATITRADGTKQVTYNGAPLYTFQQDAAAGDASSDGVNSFHAATP
jgi:predicted lipoprotein with Yx(FWY)xxD motif